MCSKAFQYVWSRTHWNLECSLASRICDAVPGCQEMNGFGEELIKHAVLQRSADGFFCGLLVKSKFAKRFVDGPPHSRKIMEIRKSACEILERKGQDLTCERGEEKSSRGLGNSGV